MATVSMDVSRAERCLILMRRCGLTNDDVAALVSIPGYVISHRRVSDVLKPNQPLDTLARSMSGQLRAELLKEIERVLEADPALKRENSE